MAAPLTPEDFDRLMTACGPLEAAPRVAVAVSGGADSLSLAFLAHDWARARGGTAVALTVDHGLRSEAAQEAAAVARWLGHNRIEHHILRWQGAKPATRVQEAARLARYDLLTRWCRDHGILHLLLAHHRDDQAETVLMRKERGSGTEGLAAMRAVALPPGAGYRWPRLLRPLLPVAKGRLEAMLTARGQDWICDPSNENRSYTRVRLRQRIRQAGDAEALLARLAAEAAEHRRAWDEVEARLTSAFARHIALSPYGYGVVRDRTEIADDMSAPFWSRLLRTIGGRAYPPRADRLDRLLGQLAAPDFRGSTIAGCVVRPYRSHVLVAREPAGVKDEAGLEEAMVWDDRFLIRAEDPGDFVVRKLGEGGVRALKRLWPEAGAWTVPPVARRSLPGLFQGGDLVGLPAFGGAGPVMPTIRGINAQFVPPVPLIW